MNSANQSQIDRLRRDIADLNKQDAREAKKEADLLGKLNRAQDGAGRTKSLSTMNMKLREAERAAHDLAGIRKKRADISSKIADKAKSLRSYEYRQAKEDERTRKKIADEQARLIREREEHERRVTQELRTQREAGGVPAFTGLLPEEPHDFFISHASEDKGAVVRDLAKALQARGAKVWVEPFNIECR